jgi:hypothetical protein
VSFIVVAASLILHACSGTGSDNGGSSPIIPSLPSNSGSTAITTDTASTGSASTQSTTTSGTIPHHIATWAYDEYWAQGSTATTAQVQQYLTYAEGGLGNVKAVADCSGSGTCHSVFYMEANQIYGSTLCPDQGSAPMIAASSENWFVHMTGYTDKAHRVQGISSVSCKAGSGTQPIWIGNNANTGYETYENTYFQKNFNSWDYGMMDSTAGTVVDQMYGGSGGGFCNGSICHSTQELPTDASVVASHASLANALHHTNGTAAQFFFNGLSFDGAQNANNLDILTSTSRFVGAVCENCIVSSNTLETGNYQRVLNAMASIDNISGASSVILSTGNAAAGSSSQIAQRLVTTAIVWLGYSEGHSVVWPNLEDTSSSLAVWPEDSLYPSQPVQSMTTGAVNIQVASGVWRREFTSCYNNTVAIGACAAILNANSGAVVVQSAWLHKTYKHSVRLNGGDAISGGTVTLNATAFTAGSTSVPGGQALLLVP